MLHLKRTELGPPFAIGLSRADNLVTGQQVYRREARKALAHYGLRLPCRPRGGRVPNLPLARLGERLSFLGALIEVVKDITSLHRDWDIYDWIAETLLIVPILLIVRLVRSQCARKQKDDRGRERVSPLRRLRRANPP